MSTAKHTPGPWHFVKENAGLMMDHGYGILYGEPDSWGWEKNLYVSVGCSGNVERVLGKGVAEANARLIAAAPDMLAVLKRISASYPGYIPDFVEAVNAAIDKAEGAALGPNDDGTKTQSLLKQNLTSEPDQGPDVLGIKKGEE